MSRKKRKARAAERAGYVEGEARIPSRSGKTRKEKERGSSAGDGAAVNSGSLKVKEIYCSILGESAFAGYPCALVRVAGCNLRCSYCDTAYAWEGGRAMSIETVMAAVEKRGLELVLVTGGEPMLQSGTPELLKRLVERGHKVLLETNGSLDLSRVPPAVHIVMDLKTPGSGFHRGNRLANLRLLKPSDEVKFVLTSRKDYLWAKKLMEERGLARRFQVVLSPAHGALDPQRLARWMLADRIPARLGLQLHKLVFGPDEKRR